MKNTISRDEIRRIRHMEIWPDDLDIFATEEGKLSSTILDAAAAAIQDVETDSNIKDYCIFSSWLSPLAANVVSERAVGSFPDNVLRANASGSKDEISACSRWAIPLCSALIEKNISPHWVLGWIDWKKHEIGVFDSIPELESSSRWAQQSLRRVIIGICSCLGKEIPNWYGDSSWKEVLASPKENERQLDTWSCGLFVLMAIKAFTLGDKFDIVNNSSKETFRDNLLRGLLALPVTRTLTRKPESQEEACISYAADSVADVAMSDTFECTGTEEAQILLTSAQGIQLDTAEPPEYVDSPPVTGKRKRSFEIDKTIKTAKVSDVDNLPAGSLANFHHFQRKKKLNSAARIKSFKDDYWVFKFTESSVTCRGCRAAVKLDQKRQYDLKNWLSHKEHCSHITGMVVKKTARVNKFAKPPAGTLSITQYLKNSSTHSKPTELSVTQNNQIDFNSADATGSLTAAKGVRIEVKTAKYNATPSIANIFHKDSGSGPRTPPKEIRIQLCKHLTGAYLKEYIMCTQTRSLGGVSFGLRARVLRQLCPYKLLPILSSSTYDDIFEIPEVDESRSV